MTDMTADTRNTAMPEFGQGEWLNVSRPLTRAGLRGQIALVVFWDYANLKCVRTFPYLNRWYRRYKRTGLTIIGIHTPEFGFGHLRDQVEAAAGDYGLQFPILLDNNHETWSRFGTEHWPSLFLVDEGGEIRLQLQGDWSAPEIEKALQIRLRRLDPDVDLPNPLPSFGEEYGPEAVVRKSTPDLYAGFRGGGLFGGALGNPQGYFPRHPFFYELPEAREEGHFFVEGVWRAWPESLAYAGQQGGRILLPYRAESVNAVMSPSADTVEVALNLRPEQQEPIVEVKQDGRFLSTLNAGRDVAIEEDGTSAVRITRPRMFQIVRNPDYESHELEIIFQASGLALYVFTFTPGVVSDLTTGRTRSSSPS
jgi:hypothetical protein